MKYESILFDLDGTLWDTTATCAQAWNNVAQKHSINFRNITQDDVKAVTGKPHADCIKETFTDVTEEETDLLIQDTITEDHRLIGEKGGALYPGVAEGLEKLAKKHRLFIVSNCQSGYIEMFLRLTGFGHLFTDFECWGNTMNPKSSNTKDVIERNDIKSGIFVGDTSGDEKAAVDNGLPFIEMTYGFGQAQSPVMSFSDFTEFTDWVLA